MAIRVHDIVIRERSGQTFEAAVVLMKTEAVMTTGSCSLTKCSRVSREARGDVASMFESGVTHGSMLLHASPVV